MKGLHLGAIACAILANEHVVFTMPFLRTVTDTDFYMPQITGIVSMFLSWILIEEFLYAKARKNSHSNNKALTIALKRASYSFLVCSMSVFVPFFILSFVTPIDYLGEICEVNYLMALSNGLNAFVVFFLCLILDVQRAGSSIRDFFFKRYRVEGVEDGRRIIKHKVYVDKPRGAKIFGQIAGASYLNRLIKLWHGTYIAYLERSAIF
jgi:hypothetical protein